MRLMFYQTASKAIRLWLNVMHELNEIPHHLPRIPEIDCSEEHHLTQGTSINS